jgi:hypothetical protein
MRRYALAIALLLGVAAAQGEVTTILRPGGELNGDGAIYSTWDWTSIVLEDDPATPLVDERAVAKDYSYWATFASYPTRTLVGIKNLLDYLPGDPDALISATLIPRTYRGDGGTLRCARVTTNWMPAAAGLNASNAAGLYADVKNQTSWANGLFCPADYDAGSVQSRYLGDSAYGLAQPFDVTADVLAMYATGNNYGWVLFADGSPDVRLYSSNSATLANQPVLEIVVVPEPAILSLLAAGGLVLLGRRR